MRRLRLVLIGIPLVIISLWAAYRPPGRARVPALEVRDADGTRVAAAVGRRNTWLLRIEVDAPPPLRDAALVLALVQNRTAY